MTLEQLRIFVGVAEREHMTAAAHSLRLTQSAVSAAISSLEQHHGVKLFDRIGRGIALTEAGRLFLGEARGVLARAADAETMLDELSGLKRGTLRVVASQTIAAYWLPPFLSAFRGLYPLLSVELAVGNTEQVAALVSAGAADLGFIEGQIDDPSLAQWQVGEDRLLVVSATPFAQPVDADWIRAAPWIVREHGSGTRSTFDRHLRRMGVDPAALRIALVLPSNESVRTAAEAGAGVAALSSLVVAPSLATGALHAASPAFGPRPFFGLRHKERYRSKAADALLDLIAS